MKLPKLVAFDLDGTLAESKQPMSADMGELVARLLSKMPVAVLSGGSWEQFQSQFLTRLPAEAPLGKLYLFPTNAAICLVHRGGGWRPEYDKRFSDSEKKKIAEALAQSLAEVGFEQPQILWGEQVQDRGGQITFSALGQDAPLEEKQHYDPTRRKRLPVAEALKRRLPELSIGVNAATSIDITPHGVDKAYGIKRLSEFTSIAPQDMLYVGDALSEGGNDAAVIPSGVRTHEVLSPRETAALIETLLATSQQVY